MSREWRGVGDEGVPWNVYPGPCKYNLEKVKASLIWQCFSCNRTNQIKQTAFWHLSFYKIKEKNPLRFSKSHLRNLKVSSKSNFYLGSDSEKAKLSKMSKVLNIWLYTILGYCYLATYLSKVLIKEIKSKYKRWC